MLCCRGRALSVRLGGVGRRLLVAAIAVVLASGPAWAGGPADATTSAAARDDARAAIPLAAISPAYRDKVTRILEHPSLFRRLPTEIVDCQGPMFTFLSLNPEVLVGIWRQLGVSNVTLLRTGPKTFKLADGNGTTGNLVIVEESCDDAAQNRIVMYATGAYDGKPFRRPVRAECVLLLRSGSVREENGREYVAARLDSFMKVDRASLELFAKAVHPLVGRTADQNFRETIRFVGNLSQVAESRPHTIEKLSGKLENVGPARQMRFAQLAHLCAGRLAAAHQDLDVVHTR